MANTGTYLYSHVYGGAEAEGTVSGSEPVKTRARSETAERDVTMKPTSTVELLKAAQAGGYAVAAFNVVDDVSLRAIVAAANRASSPVIIQASVKTAKSIGVGLLTAMFDAAVSDSRVPVALHLDHCPDRRVIEAVVAAGWSSVLFDASNRDLETAIRESREVAELAHAHGIGVESEIENIVGVEDGVGSDVIAHAYSAQQVVEAAQASGIDLIAPQLGTAHGVYHGRPKLLPERAREFRALSDKPIVLHGGTGLTTQEFQAFIEAGVSKINISTELKMTYMKSALASLRRCEQTQEWDPPTLFNEIGGAVETMAVGFFEIFGSAGRA